MPAKAQANRTWRLLLCLSILPCLVSTYWMSAGFLHLLDPTAPMPPGTSHDTVERIMLPFWVTGTGALATYWAAFGLLVARRRLFLSTYLAAAILRALTWVFMTFEPGFPSLPGFILLGVDSGVILLAMSWQNTRGEAKQLE